MCSMDSFVMITKCLIHIVLDGASVKALNPPILTKTSARIQGKQSTKKVNHFLFLF